MLIGEKLKQLRESKNLSQGDIEKRTGLKPAYTSRVEHGHTTPSVETLEKFAGALDIPLYRLFYEGDEPPKHVTPAADHGKTQVKGMVPLAKALARLDEQDRILLLAMANQMARRHMRKARTRESNRWLTTMAFPARTV
jgi:transcriptional regulator with XRE-family HTH domain